MLSIFKFFLTNHPHPKGSKVLCVLFQGFLKAIFFINKKKIREKTERNFCVHFFLHLSRTLTSPLIALRNLDDDAENDESIPLIVAEVGQDEFILLTVRCRK